MFAYYLKIAFKNLWKNKMYAAINIFGFAFSLSIFLAIILFILHEHSYNRYHTNGENIYRVIDTEKNSSGIDYRVGDILLNNFSSIKQSCFYNQVSFDGLSITYNKTGFSIKVVASTNTPFFKMFDVRFIKGNKNQPFDNLYSAILTESYAGHLFGNDDVIGKEIIYRGKHRLIISAIIEDFPSNSSFQPQMILNAENNEFKFAFSCEDYNDVSTHRWPTSNYIQLHEEANHEELIAMINKNSAPLDNYIQETGLLPLHDIYLNDPTSGGNTKQGNPSLLQLLIAIAGIILLLAIINYINLSLAQQSKRHKEIGIRKTIGASRKSLIKQFLMESIIVIAFAFGISLLVFELTIPISMQLFEQPLSIKVLFQTPYIIYLIVSILFIGAITGLFPALSFSAFNPINILGRGGSIRGSKRHSRHILTIFQFTVSISLIFCAIVIWKQIDFSKRIDLGFNDDQLLKIELPIPSGLGITNQSKAFVNSLYNHSSILNVAPSLGVPGYINNWMGSGIEGKNESLPIIYADTSFLNTFGIKLLKGRYFRPSDEGQSCLINKAAYNFFEFEDLENKRFNNGKEGGYEIVGVVDDFHISSLHSEIKPLIIIYDVNYITYATIKIKGGSISETIDLINNAWQKHCSDFPLSYEFYDDWFNNMYEKEERLGKIISYFTLLGIIISCIGILGLAIFNAERKTKEIGIRKVNGASIKNVLQLLTQEYILWVCIAFVIASPIAYFMMKSWLSDFAYKTEISWWVFLLTAVLALFIAWSSVIWNSLKAALRNPVEALRYE